MTDLLTPKSRRAKSGERTGADQSEPDLQPLLRGSCLSAKFPRPEVE